MAVPVLLAVSTQVETGFPPILAVVVACDSTDMGLVTARPNQVVVVQIHIEGHGYHQHWDFSGWPDRLLQNQLRYQQKGPDYSIVVASVAALMDSSLAFVADAEPILAGVVGYAIAVVSVSAWPNRVVAVQFGIAGYYLHSHYHQHRNFSG